MTAALMAMNALAIDIMLPALGDISADFGLINENDRQLVIVLYMLGFGVSQLFWGPLSDRFGRRPILRYTLLGYAAAGMACVFAPNFETMLLARVVQGMFAGASRVIAVAAARDLYSGRRMAQVMSLVMIVFMAAPILAPSIGQAILFIAPWRAIFWVLAGFGVIMFVWCLFRLPETLPLDRRASIRPAAIIGNYWRVLSFPETRGYMAAMLFNFAGLFAYISSSQQVFTETYPTGATYTLWFAGIAGAMSAANLLNSRIVMRMGMRRVSHTGLILLCAATAGLTLLSLAGPIGFPVFYGLTLASFFAIGLQGPNFNAIMMEPLGSLAGSGAALSGFVTSAGAALIGGVVARGYDGTVNPIVGGQFVLALLVLGIVLVTEGGKLMRSHEDRS